METDDAKKNTWLTADGLIPKAAQRNTEVLDQGKVPVAPFSYLQRLAPEDKSAGIVLPELFRTLHIQHLHSTFLCINIILLFH